MEYLSRLNIVNIMLSTTFWINVTIVFAVTLITYYLIRRLISFAYKAIDNWNNKHTSGGNLRFILFDMLKKTNRLLILFASFLFSLRFTGLPDRLFSTISHAWFLVLAIQVAIWLDQGVQSWMHRLLHAPGSNRNPVTMVILGMILRVLVWSMMLLSILANAGVDITALVASLGSAVLPLRWRCRRCLAMSLRRFPSASTSLLRSATLLCSTTWPAQLNISA